MSKKFVFILCLCLGLLGPSFALADSEHSQEPSTNPHDGYPQSELPAGIIGVALHVSAHRVGDPAALYIRAIHPEGPAAKAGLAHGDEILTVNAIALTGKTYQEVISLIRGEVGKSVTLKVKGARGIRDVTILRISESTLMGEKRT